VVCPDGTWSANAQTSCSTCTNTPPTGQFYGGSAATPSTCPWRCAYGWGIDPATQSCVQCPPGYASGNGLMCIICNPAVGYQVDGSLSGCKACAYVCAAGYSSSNGACVPNVPQAVTTTSSARRGTTTTSAPPSTTSAQPSTTSAQPSTTTAQPSTTTAQPGTTGAGGATVGFQLLLAQASWDPAATPGAIGGAVAGLLGVDPGRVLVVQPSRRRLLGTALVGLSVTVYLDSYEQAVAAAVALINALARGGALAAALAAQLGAAPTYVGASMVVNGLPFTWPTGASSSTAAAAAAAVAPPAQAGRAARGRARAWAWAAALAALAVARRGPSP